jgi:hypothetical protein
MISAHVTRKTRTHVFQIRSLKIPRAQSPNRLNGFLRNLLLGFQTRGETLLSAIHKLINSIWNKEEWPDQWKGFIIVRIHTNK